MVLLALVGATSSCGSAGGGHSGGLADGGGRTEIAPRTTLAHNVLNHLDHVPQTQSRWCWAATSATILNSMRGSNFSGCEIASQALGRNCCGNPASCNVTNSVFAFTDILRPHGVRAEAFPGTIRFDLVKDEIDNNRPVLIRVESPFGEGHFVVLVGYNVAHMDRTGEIRRHVIVSDPMYGYYRAGGDVFGYSVRWEDLAAGRLLDYRAHWTHTMLILE